MDNNLVESIAKNMWADLAGKKAVRDPYGVLRMLGENCDKDFKATLHLTHTDGKTEKIDISHPSHIRSAVHKKVEELRKKGFAGDFKVDYHHD